ncbi:lipid A export permease/ATP-binding protein MsbA [Spartinivicinus ruber]|uniref:lipid A export permease/ATP-binding protein MsbA n=1 Tax=Spartinivicinus ruber TaxID=2683272 RepID=UPI0013D80202|nr:lipid A export permease/ATP-binding protein MsbA [Spartinivicinus ruber]
MSDPKPTVESGIGAYLRLLGYVKPYWGLFAISIFGYILFALTQPGFAWLMEYFVKGLEGESDQLIYFVPMAAVTIAVLRGLGSFIGNFYIAKVANNVVHVLRCDLFNKLVTLPNSYFDNHNSGHLISRITYNVTLVTGAATDALKVVIREGFTVIFLLGLLFWTNWKLTIIFILIAPIIAGLVSYVGRKLRKLSHKIQDAMGDVTHVASETINGYRVVRSFGGEDYERNRFLDASNQNLKQSLKLVKVSAINTPILQLLVILAMAVIMFLVLYMRETSTVAELIAYVVAAGMLPKPIRQLSEVYGNIQKGIAAAENIFEQLDEVQEQDSGSYEVERVAGKLEIRQLTFQYPGAENPVLKDINLVVQPGETVAFVGHSGSGKSTLVSLIPRFYCHEKGEILLDGVPLEDYKLTNLRQQIALVNQQVTLFNDTVANNIAYGALQTKTEDDIHLAAQAAYAFDFIAEQENGFNTIVGENGVKLSGGQRQRLAIARAILKDAPVLILDEATSALDTQAERNIQAALDEVMKGRTTLVIAHRLSTIENADKIVVMDKGVIVEVGSHRELLEKQGHYARLHRLQFKEEQPLSA